MEMVEVDGLRIAYERAGDGPPLVLLHGYVGDGPTAWRRLRRLPGRIRRQTPSRKPHVAGLSFGGALALELCRRHPAMPMTLILASAYAGWGGSLSAEVAEQRLQQALVLADLAPDEFMGALLPTMFSEATAPETVDEFGASMRAFHPAGFRAIARASAEDLRDVLPGINVPTLLVYGDKDVRAPLTVAEDLEAAISGSTLVVLPDTGHLCNIEAPEDFNRAVRNFLRD